AVFLMIPLNLANIITLAAMHYLEIGLNVNTLPIVSVGVGVGIDYGIYLLSRFCEEFQISGAYSLAVANRAIRTTGKAIFFTATTMVVGVLFWYFFSSMKFQAEMGLLLAIIMFLNMLGAMVILPMLLYIFKPKFLGKATVRA
ncbi:MAG: MMPL family transporter, partial [Desulfuromonadaceae bacterium]